MMCKTDDKTRNYKLFFLYRVPNCPAEAEKIDFVKMS